MLNRSVVNSPSLHIYLKIRSWLRLVLFFQALEENQFFQAHFTLYFEEEVVFIARKQVVLVSCNMMMVCGLLVRIFHPKQGKAQRAEKGT